MRRDRSSSRPGSGSDTVDRGLFARTDATAGGESGVDGIDLLTAAVADVLGDPVLIEDVGDSRAFPAEQLSIVEVRVLFTVGRKRRRAVLRSVSRVDEVLPLRYHSSRGRVPFSPRRRYVHRVGFPFRYCRIPGANSIGSRETGRPLAYTGIDVKRLVSSPGLVLSEVTDRFGGGLPLLSPTASSIARRATLPHDIHTRDRLHRRWSRRGGLAGVVSASLVRSRSGGRCRPRHDSPWPAGNSTDPIGGLRTNSSLSRFP